MDGCEQDVLMSTDHCGACNSPCVVANGTPQCVDRMCGVASCNLGFDNCDGDPATGCETNLTSSPLHCSGCNLPCPVPAHAAAVCVNSMCGQGACEADYMDCNGGADGCEMRTSDDPQNCGGCGVTCGSGTCANSACVCLNTVLILKDDSDTGTQTLATALTSAGYAVTISPVPVYQYTGINPSPAGFGAVVVLSGGPTASLNTDMPAAGQAALVNHVNVNGNGLVLTEWAAYHVASGRWQTLAPLVLLQRTVAYSGQVIYTVDPAFTAHPLWSGLPASFTVGSTSNVGITRTGTGITRIAGSPQAIDAVAIRNTPVGRVAEVAHAGNYAPNGWTNTNMQRLMANAVGWVARCTP